MLAHLWGSPMWGSATSRCRSSDLDRSIAFYRRFADMKVVHRREDHEGHGVAWISDLTRQFVIVLLRVGRTSSTNSAVTHTSASDASRRTRSLIDSSPPARTGPPCSVPVTTDRRSDSGDSIVDPDGHNLELAYGQEVGLAVDEARPVI